MCYFSDVYLLDLCILSYQLHAQTLIFPVDPYYEFSKSGERRASLMDQLRGAFNGQPDIHGPASCQGADNQGWKANNVLEPVFSDYRRIYPWRPSFSRPDGENEPWIVYDTPREITGRISQVYMARYSKGKGPYDAGHVVEVDHISANPTPATAQPAPDLLYCFEGGTGAVYGAHDQKKYAAWSMMGFVLAHQPKNSTRYDVYIVFRGSRSGELRPLQAGLQEQGNPDWVTDLQIRNAPEKIEEISVPGKCIKGFSASLLTMLPTVMRCLQEVHNVKQTEPRQIFVTGHSLGGALASLFTGAVLLGNVYGPDAKRIPKELKDWPWSGMKRVTFSSPVVGNKKFAEILDTKCTGNRIFVEGDIVTTEIPSRSYHVGLAKGLKKIAVELKKREAIGGRLNPHEPLAVRRLLVAELVAEEAKEFSANAERIPMRTPDSEPWKLFVSAKAMLETLVRGRTQTQLAALIPSCEGFLLELLRYLKTLYTKEVNGEIIKIEQEIVHNAGQSDTFTKLTSLCETWESCGEMFNMKPSLHLLIGQCIFLNGVSADVNVYVDSKKFAVVRSLLDGFIRIR